jgi:hypothetical protein
MQPLRCKAAMEQAIAARPAPHRACTPRCQQHWCVVVQVEVQVAGQAPISGPIEYNY